MKLLALDPAASTGFCLVDVDVENDTANIYKYGFIEVDTSSNYQGDHCINLMERLQNILNAHAVDHICIEDFFFSKRFATGCTVNVAFRTAIHILARQNSIDYTIVNISAWKTYIAGRSTPTKEQKKKWGADAAKKLYIQQALWEKYGFRFPNHSLSEKSGKPIAFRYDIVDVVGQAVYFCGMIQHIRNMTMSVDIPENVTFKRKIKKQFIY